MGRRRKMRKVLIEEGEDGVNATEENLEGLSFQGIKYLSLYFSRKAFTVKNICCKM